MGNDLSIPFIPLPLSIAPEVYVVVSVSSSSQILIDVHLTTTPESAMSVQRIMNEQCLRRAIVVTDSYQLFRVILAFRHLGLNVEGENQPSKRGKAREVALAVISFHGDCNHSLLFAAIGHAGQQQ